MDLPENLTDLPKMQLKAIASGDLLSQVLAQIRLTGDRFYSVTLHEGECLALEKNSANICIVQQGRLQISSLAPGDEEIKQGDVLLLPHDPSSLKITASHGTAVIVVCRFWFDAGSFEAMIFALPGLIHIRQNDAMAWAEGLVHYMLIEAEQQQPGGALMVSRLIDLTVIRILRTWVAQGKAAGWLGSLADERIARTLKVIHSAPGKPLGIGELSAIAGMSRSGFCDRFNALVGSSPIRYQNEYRLRLAKTMLSAHNRRISEVGFAMGYESESSFSRAYKAYFGKSPREDRMP